MRGRIKLVFGVGDVRLSPAGKWLIRLGSRLVGDFGYWAEVRSRGCRLEEVPNRATGGLFGWRGDAHGD